MIGCRRKVVLIELLALRFFFAIKRTLFIHVDPMPERLFNCYKLPGHMNNIIHKIEAWLYMHDVALTISRVRYRIQCFSWFISSHSNSHNEITFLLNYRLHSDILSTQEYDVFAIATWSNLINGLLTCSLDTIKYACKSSVFWKLYGILMIGNLETMSHIQMLEFVVCL